MKGEGFAHFDANTPVGQEGLQGWFTSNKSFWKEIITTSGVLPEQSQRMIQILDEVSTTGWSHGDERPDYIYSLLNRWGNYLNTVDSDIMRYDEEKKQQKVYGKKSEIELSPENLTLYNLFQELREDSWKAINRAST
jgi:hypothetical protein